MEQELISQGKFNQKELLIFFFSSQTKKNISEPISVPNVISSPHTAEFISLSSHRAQGMSVLQPYSKRAVTYAGLRSPRKGQH